MMLSLAIVATFAEIFSRTKFSLTDFASKEGHEEFAAHHHSPVHSSLSKIEMPSILFFLGILMAVAALESLGVLFNFADSLKEGVPLFGTELEGTQVSDLVVIFFRNWICSNRQRAFSSCQFGNVLRTFRQSIVALYCLLGRNGRKYVNHWFCCWSCSYGNGENRFLLVLKKDFLVSTRRIFGWFAGIP